MSLYTLEQDETGDVMLDNGTFRALTGDDAVVQRIRNRLKLWKAEFYLGPSNGMDWETLLNRKPFSSGLTKAEIRRVLTKDPIVTNVVSLGIESFDAATRSLVISFQVNTDEGLVTGTADL